MLGSATLVAFVATTDVEAARAFYRDTLGLRLVDDTPFAVVFDANGTTVRVTPVEHATVAPYTVLGWEVDDIGATVSDLSARGVVFHHYEGLEQNDVGIWRAPGGTLVAWFPDPEGNTLSVTQLPSA